METSLYQALDAYRRPFGLVLAPATGHYSLTLDVAPPEGPATRGTGKRPSRGLTADWAARLGGWLAAGSTDPDRAGSAVVIQQETGTPGYPSVRVLIQVTWSAPPTGGDPAALAVEAGTRLPGLVRSLRRAGVGGARPLTAGELAFVVRSAYLPGPDDAWTGTRLQWSDAAPSDRSEAWHHLRHGSATSITWALHRASLRMDPAAVLEVSAGVPPDAARVRVTLLQRHDGDRDDQASDLTALVTLTAIIPPEDLAATAEVVLDRLPVPLRPWLRPSYGSQAAAFASGLPAGILPTVHTAPPSLLAGPE